MKLLIDKRIWGSVVLLGILFWAGVVTAAPNTDHYRIVHRIFRDVVLKGNQIEIDQLEANAQGGVSTIWKQERKTSAAVVDAELRAISAHVFDVGGKKVLVIRWPEPSVSPEAYISVIVFSERPQYYCFEMMDTSTAFGKLFGEGGMAVLGQWTAETHAFIGMVELPEENRGVIDVLRSKNLL